MAWNGSDNRKDASVTDKVRPVKPSPWRGVLAGVVVVVLALAAAFFLFSRHEEGVEEQQSGTKGKISSAIPASAASRPAVRKGKADAPKQGAGGARVPAMAADEADESAATNSVSSSDKTGKEDNRLFKNPMDQLLSMVLPKKPGASVPPLPDIGSITFTPEEEDQLLERLAANDDDSDEKLERKELVQALRDEYHELKKTRGWSFVDYVKALEAKVNLDAEVLRESIKIHETVFNDASISDEEYAKTLAKINAVLAERGIEPIGKPGEEEDSEESDEQQEQQKEN